MIHCYKLEWYVDWSNYINRINHADMMDLKARIHGPAQAYVMEARLDEGRGPLVTTIVKAGTLFNLLF
uniref:Uncharacterized protein n=1 Tax=Glycine max TaxID=3847 RepID=A0A0R0KEP9_SOYBN